MVFQWTIIGVVPAVIVLSLVAAGKGQFDYWNYQQDCQQLLQQASNSGIVSSAVNNLSKALPCFKDEADVSSYYSELKTNLDFLTSQPKNVPVPITVRDSIQDNVKAIEQVKQSSLLESWFPLYLLIGITLGGIIMVLPELLRDRII